MSQASFSERIKESKRRKKRQLNNGELLNIWVIEIYVNLKRRRKNNPALHG